MEPESSQPDTRASLRSRIIWATLIGAVSIHVVLFICAWIKGAIWGSGGDPGEMFSGSARHDLEYGLVGGRQCTNQLLALYVFSLGLIPIALSIIGAIVGFILSISLCLRLLDDKFGVPQSSTASVSVIRAILVYSAAAYTAMMLVLALTLGFGPGALAGSILWLIQLLNAAIWGTSAVAAYLRFRRWEISTGVICIGVILSLMHAYFMLPLPGLLLAAVLLLAYAMATGTRRSDVNVKTLSPPASDSAQAEEIRTGGTNGFAVFLFGGFSFHAVVCLFTLFAAIGNRNTDNWGVFMPIVIGVWGIPILGTLAAISHARTGPWSWLNNRQAWRNAAYSFLTCLFLWGVIVASH